MCFTSLPPRWDSSLSQDQYILYIPVPVHTIVFSLFFCAQLLFHKVSLTPPGTELTTFQQHQSTDFDQNTNLIVKKGSDYLLSLQNITENSFASAACSLYCVFFISSFYNHPTILFVFLEYNRDGAVRVNSTVVTEVQVASLKIPLLLLSSWFVNASSYPVMNWSS